MTGTASPLDCPARIDTDRSPNALPITGNRAVLQSLDRASSGRYQAAHTIVFRSLAHGSTERPN